MCILKRSFLTISIVLGFVSAASAQSDWQGLYVGGTVGGAIHRSTANTTSSFSTSGYFAASSVNSLTIAGRQRLNNDTFTGGVEGGYNRQNENTVFGIETDYVASRMNASQKSSVDYTCSLCAGTGFSVSQTLKTRWLYTLRPRAGFATGRTLYYITGGLALTKLNFQESFSDNFGPATQSAEFNKTKAGWIIGIGASVRLNPELSVKGEYLYSSFGRSSTTSNNLNAPTPFPANVFDHSVALHSHILRGGVDYRW